jgi:superfamily II DNA or RNA helicase
LETRGKTMPRMSDIYRLPPDLVLGTRLSKQVPPVDQRRQRTEVVEILSRFRKQPGVILADEVGMGKTFVALAVAYSVAVGSPRGPVIIMAPANLVEKWEQDLKTFCELYLENRHPVRLDTATRKALTDSTALRYGIARHSIELMKLLDDPSNERSHIILLAQGAMSRRQTDRWVRLALIAEALRRHGRGGASRLIQVKRYIHRYLAELLWAIGEEKSHGWGDELWQHLLTTDPRFWKEIYNEAAQDGRKLSDDPVPKAVARSLHRIDLKELAKAMEAMPIRAVGGGSRISERLHEVRRVLREIEEDLWKNLLAQARWRSPLLVMDEAHHLKNPATSLARQLQSPDLEQDLRTGDGAMAEVFDRMLFLTATPFQLGHHELLGVLHRFGDVRWNPDELGDSAGFQLRLKDLGERLTESQRAAIALQRSWGRLQPADCNGDTETWWRQLQQSSRDDLTNHQRAVMDAFVSAKDCRVKAEAALRPWILRHNKGVKWADTEIDRRQRVIGAAIVGQDASKGVPVPTSQLLPFFLAARSAVKAGQDLLGEALSSSYEAFRFTRQNRTAQKDDQEAAEELTLDLAHAKWYLGEFDSTLEQCSGSAHPKVHATVRKVVDLWETGEKVLVFAFYRQTCRALRIHISDEIERRLIQRAQYRLRENGVENDPQYIERLVERIQKRFFDDVKTPGRKAVDAALGEILKQHSKSLAAAHLSKEQREMLIDVMRRFLRVKTTLVRCFPLAELDSLPPEMAVDKTLSFSDESGISWQQKFKAFVEFITEQCSTEERRLYLEAASRTQTGGIRVEGEESDEDEAEDVTIALANVQEATGRTKREKRGRLMRAFNTPFFPDILVCSQVMGEGVDLQRFCRHVIHHDLAWNPSDIEQRTGRIDRLGCKAEGKQSIVVYLPYLDGTADERQYRVMTDRERWFRVVMGQDEVARLITSDSSGSFPLPDAISNDLSFQLCVPSSTS